MCWNTSSAFTPVGLALRDPATSKIVRTLGDAARVLMRDWPRNDGDEYIAAVKACVDAIEGKLAPERFREVFLRAADEAGIVTLNFVQKSVRARRPHLPSPVRR
ncbi:DUF982 domain-containing protein (plasmid) [Rhizobium ruizarguesonis]|uniref:DUF982 domain-containing protein n=1 Tax=Rhizobium ruizarguesonis TaxID=2081791 RepID=UPI0010305783|nr:DUF982 domain-containing protein [Rhizobium ruizarguesonis]TAW62669.1 DUF982 domain-containing protein [Rhizobium ruizarguesonis]TAW81818.1 DUF982 domain-containing protein [Rhizobium ruizarguesonis]TAX67091.1 DUF982 domain-containing protein [Rhizobium ruizarguesonis]